MKEKLSPKIFISYRREDSLWFTNLLDQTLAAHFGDEYIFRDVHDIAAGEDFEEVIKAQVKSANILLAVIGKEWQSIAEKRRASADEDYVQLEIATALRKKDMIVVPILVEGAAIPRKQDLPDDLKRLVSLQARVLTDQSWINDTNKLIRELEVAFQKATANETKPITPAVEADLKTPGSLYGFYGGSLAGLLCGTIVGVVYVRDQPVEWWRAILIGFYGLVAGAMLSFFINAGIARGATVSDKSPYIKLVGGTLGGGLGGILAAIIGGIGFAWLSEGDPIEPLPIIFAVAISSACIAAGILLPHQSWQRRLLTIIVISAVTTVAVFFARWLLIEELGLPGTFFTSSSATSIGVMVLGLVGGIMSGVQVGAALLFDELSSLRTAKS